MCDNYFFCYYLFLGKKKFIVKKVVCEIGYKEKVNVELSLDINDQDCIYNDFFCIYNGGFG